MIIEKKCNRCGIIKPTTDFYIDKRWGTPRSECKSCWQIRKEEHKSGVILYMGKTNKTCSQYLGVHVAEQLLSKVFSDVQRMPLTNHGYDFICGKGYKVEVKSACLRKTCQPKGKEPMGKQWLFKIKKNNIANYFALLAFDGRDSLNPLYFWLIPGTFLKDCMSLTISPSTVSKLEAFEKPIDKIIFCCNKLKDI